MYTWKQNDTSKVVPFYMVSSSDHVAEQTGKTLTVTVSKNGGSFGSVSGTVAEVANGVYKLTPAAGDVDTLGPIIFRATATGCDPCVVAGVVVATDAYDAVRGGMTALPNANANASNGLITRGTGTGQLNPITGRVGIDLQQTQNPAYPNTWSGVTIKGVSDPVIIAGVSIQSIWEYATRTLTSISDSSGVTTLLSRIIGTLASGTHQPQSGDSYAKVNGELCILDTTIQSLTNQGDFTLAAGSPDDDVYNGCWIVFRASGNPNQIRWGTVYDYTGSTRRVQLTGNPTVFFNLAPGDRVIVYSVTSADITRITGSEQFANDFSSVIDSMLFFMLLNMIEQDGGDYRFKANALEMGGGGGEDGVGYGDGSIIVDQDWGGGDSLSYKTVLGVGIDNALVSAYLKIDYDAGFRSVDYVQAQVMTTVDGKFNHVMNLDPGAYTFVYWKQGEYGPDIIEVTVTGD